MKFDSNIVKATSVKPHWQELVRKYQSPDHWKSIGQLLNSVIPYLIMWYLMYRSLSVSYWLTLGLSIPAAGFMTRVFIIMHDCGHGSFFKSKRATHIVGTICGILTHTPYFQWTREHAIHHATSGDLSRRGVGDVNTLTVKEYLALPFWERMKYRAYRNPFVLLVIGPHFIFLLCQRFPGKHSGKRERNNVYLTNIALAVIYSALVATIGWKAVLLVAGPIAALSGAWGIWLFYVQHQYESTYWRQAKEWDYPTAALMGSSYLKLPKLFQWFSGNIGFHHIHHLSPKIPNYKLETCHNETPAFQQSPTFGFFASLKTASLKLWDEDREQMVGFKRLREGDLR